MTRLQSGAVPGRALIDLAAVVVDCAEAPPVAAFYEAACGGRIVRQDADSVWLEVGSVTVVFREVADHQPPSWPGAEVPMQAHLDYETDDLEAAEAELQRLGATTEDHQPHRADGLVVMRDPAGHLFCVGTRL